MLVWVVRLALLAALVFAAACAVRGVRGSPVWLWIGALALYLAGVPFAMSIGWYMLAPAFLLAGMGVARLVRPQGEWLAAAIGAAAGLVIWLAWLLHADLSWVFYPVLGPLDLIFGG